MQGNRQRSFYFLSLDFGLREFGVLDAEERLKGYRRYVYEAVAVDRFRYRTRYFSDSGIIGTKEFVSINYKRFKDIFMLKREKVPKAVAGLDGVYSLKRLAES